MQINYQLLHDSYLFYQEKGYQRIELPWTVTGAVDDITRPIDKIPFVLKHNNKHLVASGEQSFLYQYLKGYLPKGMFQGITPCFRNEDYDFLHTKNFMKNELIKTDSTTSDDLNKMVETALRFFSKYFKKQDLNIVQTNDGFDIEIYGNELGSYGIRETTFLKWIYGTGLAEPRTSSLINLHGISQN